MHRSPWTLLLGAALAAAPAAARAQSFAELCRTVRTVRLGQWSSYQVTGRADATAIRFAIVGSEQLNDTAYYWYEMVTTGAAPHASPPGPPPPERSIYQVLMGGLGTARPDVRGLIVKLGDQPAVRVPDLMVAAFREQAARSVASQTVRYCSNGEVVGWETVTVPAGRFKTLHVRSGAGDAWISRDVPFGLVKVRPADGSEMQLLQSGWDATSSITEHPRPGVPGFALPG